MDPIENLMAEHRVIERALKLIEELAYKVYSGETVDERALQELINFFREFADKCHHGKEETSLFPRLESRGIPREGGPIGVMLAEHELGRSYVRALKESVEKYYSGKREAKEDIVENALAYARLLREHIFKEDNILFNMARAVLDSEDLKELSEEFERIEVEKLGKGRHEELISKIGKLEAELRLL
ncbi:MAG: hemerythrin domain-containing protein [Thermoprotei archaeon]|nr:hemerythrin domain-containing protein [Thermoprotei archaeon]